MRISSAVTLVQAAGQLNVQNISSTAIVVLRERSYRRFFCFKKFCQNIFLTLIFKVKAFETVCRACIQVLFLAQPVVLTWEHTTRNCMLSNDAVASFNSAKKKYNFCVPNDLFVIFCGSVIHVMIAKLQQSTQFSECFGHLRMAFVSKLQVESL